MALGRREGRSGRCGSRRRLPRSPGHPFYKRMNGCWAKRGSTVRRRAVRAVLRGGQGRPSIPPGVYFRMLLVGYFEGIDSQRGIAWRCSDSLALREFLGAGRGEAGARAFVADGDPPAPAAGGSRGGVRCSCCGSCRSKGLLRGQDGGVDATTLEANAAMKSIVRRDTGEDVAAVHAAARRRRRGRRPDGRGRAAPRSRAQEEAGLERGVAVAERSRRAASRR